MVKKISLVTVLSLVVLGIFTGCSKETTKNETITYFEAPRVEIYNMNPYQELGFTKQTIENGTKVAFDTTGGFEVQLIFNAVLDKESVLQSIDISNSENVEINLLSNKKVQLSFKNPKEIDYDITVKKGMKDIYQGQLKEDFHLKINPTFISEAELNAKTQEYMNPPKFIAGETELFKDTYSYDDTFVPLYSDTTTFQILFDDDLDLDTAYYSVQMPFDYRVDGNKISFSLDKSDTGNRYLIKINENLKDKRNRRLKKEISFHIIPIQGVKAHYKVIGVEGEYNFDEGITYPYQAPNFTDEPKTIEIEFTGNAVNKSSVEEAIKKSLKDKRIEYSLSWGEDNKVIINISSFKKLELISLELGEAKDRNDFNIVGNFYFNVYKPNKVYSYDKNTETIEVLKEFHDKPYHFNYNPYFTKYLVMADGSYNNYLYNLDKDSVSEISNDLGFPYYFADEVYSISEQWLDEATVIFYDRSRDAIMKYSFEENSLETIVNTKELGINPFYIKVSPDGGKIAIEDLMSKYVYVYTVDGTKIYEKPDTFIVMQDGPTIFYVDWLDNDTIVYETDRKIAGRMGETEILKTDIVNSKTEVLVKHGINPYAFPDYHSLFYWDYEEGKYILEIPGKKIIIGSDHIYNVHYLSNNKIIFNRDQQLVTYNLETKEEKIIGEGNIIGTSKDGSKILFTVNNYFPFK